MHLVAGHHAMVDDVTRGERPGTAPIRTFSRRLYKQSLKGRSRPNQDVENYSLKVKNALKADPFGQIE